MLADRLRVTQIVVLCDEAVMELFVLSTPYRKDLQGLQLLDGRDNGCPVNIDIDRSNTHDSTPSCALHPGWRQDYMTRSMQRQQQPPADHVAGMTVGLNPVPRKTQAYGQRAAGISLMSFDQGANEPHIVSSGTSSSVGNDRLHEVKPKCRRGRTQAPQCIAPANNLSGFMKH